jgi:hypothetical protein
MVGKGEGRTGSPGQEAGVLCSWLPRLPGSVVEAEAVAVAVQRADSRSRLIGGGRLKHAGVSMAQCWSLHVPLGARTGLQGVERGAGRSCEREVTGGLSGERERPGDAGCAVAPRVPAAGYGRGVSGIEFCLCDVRGPALGAGGPPVEQPVGSFAYRFSLAVDRVPGQAGPGQEGEWPGDPVGHAGGRAGRAGLRAVAGVSGAGVGGAGG